MRRLLFLVLLLTPGIASATYVPGTVRLTDINTSLKFKNILGDETGSGALVFADSPTLISPVLGAATATSLTIGGSAAVVLTNLDTSLEWKNILGDETGSGLAVFNDTPTLIAPILGAAVATSLSFGADPGDAGRLRLSNTDLLVWENGTPGTDMTLGVDVNNTLSYAGGHFAIDNSKRLHFEGAGGDTYIQKSGGTLAFVDDNNVGLTVDNLDATVAGTLNVPTVGLGTTGVVISSDDDGAIKILGRSTGNDESLLINLDDGTANTIGIDSDSGASIIRFGDGASQSIAQLGMWGSNASAPSYSRNDDFDTGMYFPGPNTVGLSANGSSGILLAGGNTGPEFQSGGPWTSWTRIITSTTTVGKRDCGINTILVTAGINGGTITLPEASILIGCHFKFVYTGASGGALLDISPLDSDADGIFGVCGATTFTGTADADIGLDLATSVKYDFIELDILSASEFLVTDCRGIWNNN